MTSPVSVALSGATGNLGRILRKALPELGYTLRSAGGRSVPTPLFPNEDVMHGDLRDPGVVDRLLQGVDVLVHMAGTSVERPLSEIIDNNLVALHAVYEGARRHRVKRIVFASSNHAFGMHPVDHTLRRGACYRPDGFYGLSKMWGEGMARVYWDKHGIESVCLRIGTASQGPPENRRHLSTWLGAEDLIHLVQRAIEATDVGYTEVWGISANSRAYYDMTEPNEIGYSPRQNAERWADEVSSIAAHADPVASHYQGGAFVVDDYTPATARPVLARKDNGELKEAP
ncbi:NAD(P)-dependent oxidoreductase [Candidimonas sp. SYP-B2681]|uniref:NAD-dependent epimerase/dehydratase family protein n=1 Tax=Candidimonas sp. SYP-B2681 TaxID=2497686 RepID=UPI000F89067D|nr:NAD(P)-dependent oxidoreductase [Candidimonas sp. SYP-B2681]RTZ45392.1 NAD(P)-dependent oxidoreductase [Candidimonas sp. SYP-B2681]